MIVGQEIMDTNHPENCNLFEQKILENKFSLQHENIIWLKGHWTFFKSIDESWQIIPTHSVLISVLATLFNPWFESFSDI